MGFLQTFGPDILSKRIPAFENSLRARRRWCIPQTCGHTTDGRKVLYRGHTKAPATALGKDPCSFGFPELLTAAHIQVPALLSAHLDLEPFQEGKLCG